MEALEGAPHSGVWLLPPVKTAAVFIQIRDQAVRLRSICRGVLARQHVIRQASHPTDLRDLYFRSGETYSIFVSGSVVWPNAHSFVLAIQSRHWTSAGSDVSCTDASI